MDCKRISLSLSVLAVAISSAVLATDVAAQAATAVASRGAPAATADAATYYGAVKSVLETNCVTCPTREYGAPRAVSRLISRTDRTMSRS